MSQTQPRLRRVGARSELCIVVACHTFVVAIPTRFVSRLVLDEDVTPVAERPDLVQAGAEAFVAASLGPLLGLPALAEAWVLLHVPHASHRVAIALRTGACLMVREVSVEAPLPRGIFEARGQAVLGAFVADAAHGFAGSTLYGLMLDPVRLWTGEELEAALSALRGPRPRKER